jgi:hypothetical protein
MVEWCVNGPLGVEQGFTLAEAPGCAGPKVLMASGIRRFVLSSSMTATRPLLTLALALVSCAGSGAPRAPAPESGAAAPAAAPPRAAAAPAAPVSRAAGSPAEVCVAVMHQTRDCADVYVPGLLALRVRLDRPAGIAARFKAEGKEAMVKLAHTQFSADWSDEAVARNCKALSEKPAEEQERIVAPDRHCLETTDCSLFTTCDLAHKEKRWTASH